MTTTEIAASSSPSPLATIAQNSARLGSLFDLVRMITFREAEIRRALTEDERSGVQLVLASADQAMLPGTHVQIASSISNMLSAFSSSANTENAKAAVANYTKLCEDLPRWAVSQAAYAFARGDVPGQDKRFAPNPAQFRAEVSRRLEPIRDAQYKARVLLAAVPERQARRVPFDWRKMAGLSQEVT